MWYRQVRDELLPLIRRLHATRQARAVAAAGQRFAQSHLSFDAVLSYFRSLLHGYAAARAVADDAGTRSEGGTSGGGGSPAERATALLADGYVRIDDESTLLRLTGMCDQCKRNAFTPSCVPAPVAPACSLWAPKGGSRCLEARCCKGWDCSTRELGC